jgi:hypothetical protein
MVETIAKSSTGISSTAQVTDQKPVLQTTKKNVTAAATKVDEPSRDWKVTIKGSTHHVKDGTYGDTYGDDKGYGVEASRSIDANTIETYSAKARLYTPAKRDNQWFDTGTCTVGYAREHEGADGSAYKLGADLGMTNGVCKDALVDVQNWYHREIFKRNNLRQSPQSSSARPYVGIEAMYRPPLKLEFGNSDFAVSLQPQFTAELNSVFATVRAGPVLAAQGHGVKASLWAHGDATGFDERNRDHGARTLNAGITAKLDVNLSRATTLDIPGNPELSLQVDKQMKTTMPGVDHAPPLQIGGSLSVKF